MRLLARSSVNRRQPLCPTSALIERLFPEQIVREYAPYLMARDLKTCFISKSSSRGSSIGQYRINFINFFLVLIVLVWALKRLYLHHFRSQDFIWCVDEMFT